MTLYFYTHAIAILFGAGIGAFIAWDITSRAALRRLASKGEGR